MNATLINLSANENCVLLTVAGAGALTSSKCYLLGEAYAICEFVDGETTDGDPCKFPFK
jgi:hypothetical protein